MVQTNDEILRVSLVVRLILRISMIVSPSSRAGARQGACQMTDRQVTNLAVQAIEVEIAEPVGPELKGADGEDAPDGLKMEAAEALVPHNSATVFLEVLNLDGFHSALSIWPCLPHARHRNLLMAGADGNVPLNHESSRSCRDLPV